MANVFAKVFGHHKCKSEVEVVSMEEFAGHTHSLAGDSLKDVVPIEKGGTGAKTAALARTALGVTPKNIGAPSLSEENSFTKAMTAPSYGVKAGWPAVYFYDTEGVQRGYIVFANGPYAQIATKDPNSAYYENYLLPKAETTLKASVWYDILTSKKPVTVKQGGTGADNKFDALVNLGLIVNNGRANITAGTTKSVRFEIPFTEVPTVILTPEHPTGELYAENVTTEGFTIRVSGVAGTSNYTGVINWLAITRERQTAGI